MKNADSIIGNWKLVIGVIGVGYWSLLLLPNQASASSYTSFGVYPPKISIISPPSQKVKIPLKVINGADLETLTFSASSIKTDEEGSVELTDTKEEATSWLKINNTDLSNSREVIDASAESTINLTIDIPKNALANDHYIALIISSQNNESFSTTNSRSVAQIAIPIIISVKETKIAEELSIEKFEIPTLSLNSEIPVTFKVKNPGKYLVETIGTITSTGPLSKKRQEILPREIVTAGNSRIVGGKNFTFQTSSLGPTKITISIQLDQSDPLTVTKNVFIIPVYLLVPILIVPVLIILTAYKNKPKPSQAQ